MADWREDDWDNLLDYIQDGTVIPVIGPELVTIREGDQEVYLYRWIAHRLAGDLNLPIAELPEGFGLNDVVSMHLRRRGEREELYAQIHRMLRKAAPKPSESLKTLAGISGFKLFISLTFDSMLADAIGGAQQISYSPNTVRDLACPKADLQQPAVFHLLGRASASPDYAICDDDLLEFLHAMQDKQRQPKTLFDELRGNHLLILGCSFGDWLARFFLRTARNLELSQKRRRCEVIVGDKIVHDARLTQFLESFSPDTRVIPLTAPQFVTELAARWQAVHPPAPDDSTAQTPREEGTNGKSIPNGAIFVSYARDDLAAASLLAEGLRAAGLEVWFDKDALKMGDAWARSIRRGLERCSLFLPVISQKTLSEENRRRYFWREWNDADELAKGMAPDEKYIVPVMIDDTRIDHATLPDSFRKAQGETLPDGKVTPAAVELLVELVRKFHRRQRAA